MPNPFLDYHGGNFIQVKDNKRALHLENGFILDNLRFSSLLPWLKLSSFLNLDLLTFLVRRSGSSLQSINNMLLCCTHGTMGLDL